MIISITCDESGLNNRKDIIKNLNSLNCEDIRL